MLPRIDTIVKMRTKLGITQKKLASMVGVSTSMINQVESGRSKPSYETARRIFDSLATLEGDSSGKVAGDVCSHQVVKTRSDQTLDMAISKMRKFSISQIPVYDGTALMGLITEDGIMRHLDGDSPDLKKTKISTVMDTAPPIVDYATPANALVMLIRMTKCILVSKNSAVIGIITASDTLRLAE